MHVEETEEKPMFCLDYFKKEILHNNNIYYKGSINKDFFKSIVSTLLFPRIIDQNENKTIYNDTQY